MQCTPFVWVEPLASELDRIRLINSTTSFRRTKQCSNLALRRDDKKITSPWKLPRSLRQLADQLLTDKLAIPGLHPSRLLLLTATDFAT